MLMKKMFRIALSVLVAAIMFALVIFAISSIMYVTAPLVGRLNEQIQVESGNNRRYTYEQFFALNAAVTSLKSKFCTIKAQSEMPGYTESQQSMLLTNQIGIKSQIANKVNEYNSRAANRNDNRFLDTGLPDRLDEHVTC